MMASTCQISMIYWVNEKYSSDVKFTHFIKLNESIFFNQHTVFAMQLCNNVTTKQIDVFSNEVSVKVSVILVSSLV